MPEDQRQSIGGISSGTLQFSIEFRDVNGDQQIEAPARARPLSELTQSLGGAGALGDALGAAGDEEDPSLTTTTPEDQATVPETTPTVPEQPTPRVPAPDSGGSSTAPDASDFRAYADCLDEARPEDTEALQRCAELLQQ